MGRTCSRGGKNDRTGAPTVYCGIFCGVDSFVSGGVCDRAHAYKAQDCSGGGRSAVLRTGGTGDRIPWKPHHAFGTGTARGSGAVCLGDDFSDDEAFLRVDGRFDWRDGGRRGAADGGYGVGGGGQPIHDGEELAHTRGANLYFLDKNAKIRFSHENQDVMKLYNDFLEKPLSHKSHMLLHTDHTKWDMPR